MKRLTVFCASSNAIAAQYFEATEEVASILVEENIEIVFGGGGNGLMGKLADVALAKNGKIKGIIPDFLQNVELGHPGVKDMTVVPDMRERKHLLIQETDGVLALAGGCGTLEELFEVMTLKRLGKFTGPIIILNTGGYYDALIEMLEKIVSEGFMQKEHLQMWTVIKEPSQLTGALKNAPKWGADSLKFAVPK